ncbi:MAG: hypothetical protein JKY25_07845 [Robiginitomaculum sp.]|nr:hypothetical protein [Robiginitomaculum sp.]
MKYFEKRSEKRDNDFECFDLKKVAFYGARQNLHLYDCFQVVLLCAKPDKGVPLARVAVPVGLLNIADFVLLNFIIASVNVSEWFHPYKTGRPAPNVHLMLPHIASSCLMKSHENLIKRWFNEVWTKTAHSL